VREGDTTPREARESRERERETFVPRLGSHRWTARLRGDDQREKFTRSAGENTGDESEVTSVQGVYALTTGPSAVVDNVKSPYPGARRKQKLVNLTNQPRRDPNREPGDEDGV